MQDALARLREHVTAFAADERDRASRRLVWNALRHETNHYRRHREAEWALPEAEVALLDPIIASLTREDLVDRGRALAQKHRTWEQAPAAACPRTAVVLFALAEDYERDAHAKTSEQKQLRLRR